MNFDWDAKKAKSNQVKHPVNFEDAARVFLDPLRIEAIDYREGYGEDRWKTIGWVDPVLLAVVYAVRGKGNDVIRLISARKADAYERKQYREFHS